MPRLFRALESTGRCHFEVIGRIPQLTPRSAPATPLRSLGRGGGLASKEEEIGIQARGFLRGKPNHYVLLVDDLEYDRAPRHQEVYQRYRNILDTMLSAEEATRAAVHFLVMMLEAYYFADSAAINSVLGTNLHDHNGDVEEIRHPKNELKALYPGFKETTHGQQIVEHLDLEHVLGNPATCASLRALTAWCLEAMNIRSSEARFQMASGMLHPVTSSQMQR